MKQFLAALWEFSLLFFSGVIPPNYYEEKSRETEEKNKRPEDYWLRLLAPHKED